MRVGGGVLVGLWGTLGAGVKWELGVMFTSVATASGEAGKVYGVDVRREDVDAWAAGIADHGRANQEAGLPGNWGKC